jgi:uncharacterized damage-inducible protein DinB
MKQQLIEAWRTNNKMNLLFIDSIDDEGMQKTLSKRGGRTVYLQLVHSHNVRLGWLESMAKDIFLKHKKLDAELPYNRKNLRAAFEESSSAIEELIDRSWDDEGKLKSFKKGLIPFIGYLISHESHHRGHAMLTIKQSGVTIPEKLRWGLWEWDK